MTIEQAVLDYLAEAQKWVKVSTDTLILACEESYNPEQVRNALRRLKRARKIVYVGPRSCGYWRTV